MFWAKTLLSENLIWVILDLSSQEPHTNTDLITLLTDYFGASQEGEIRWEMSSSLTFVGFGKQTTNL